MISVRNFTNEKLKSQIDQMWNQDKCEVKSVVIETDTRVYRRGNAFFAIKGEKHDPFKYVEDILVEIPLIVFESTEENNQLARNWAKKFPKTFFISVKNSIRFLQSLSELHVLDWYSSTTTHYQIAISGSNGKTTTKEMLYHILSHVFGKDIIGTKKNNNNHIGVPLTLLDINPNSTKAAVVEFGSNHPGEMKVLCDLAHPNVGITTNIGFTHMEFFNELKDVFVEEGEIFHEIMKQTKQKGFFLINDDDEFVKTFPNFSNTKRFSCTNPMAEYFYEIFVDRVKIKISQKKEINIKNAHITGSHNFSNLANALVIAQELFPEKLDDMCLAASSFKPTANRSQWIIFQNKDIFLDAYNANPSSMKAALRSFVDYCLELGLKKSDLLVIIGEMKELGMKSAEFHYEFAQWLSTLGLPHVIYVGNFQSEIKSGCPNVLTVDNVENVVKTFENKLANSKKCFIKASRSLQLERLIGITKG